VELQGYADGWHGFKLSALMAWYELRKYSCCRGCGVIQPNGTKTAHMSTPCISSIWTNQPRPAQHFQLIQLVARTPYPPLLRL
jgi:hypothetical protein